MSELGHPLVKYYQDHLNDLVNLTMEFVNYETPTGDKAHVDELGRCIEGYLKSLKADVERLSRDKVGDILSARWNANHPGKPLMFMMHMDTVWVSSPIGA